jgi:cell division septation protein DedD
MDSEKPIRLSIEEVREDQNDHEKPVAQKEFDITPEEDTSKKSITPEEVQQETIFFNKKEHRMADLSAKAVRNKLTIIGIIVSIVFFIVTISFLLGYFVWKDSSKDMLEIKSMQALAHNKQLAITDDKFRVSDSPQGLDLIEKSMVKSNQIRKPLTAIYTVQVGAFSNIAYARSLQTRLANRGYHCYISTPNSKGEGKLHKVLIGKFGNRKKAEFLSKKISETENIQTFVTVRENNI